MKWRHVLVYCLMTICLHGVAAESDVPELDSRYTHYYATYRLNEDVSHVETHDWATRVLQERALEGVKSHSISYSTSIQKLEILHAYTLKGDGRRIDVPQTNFQLEVNTGREQGAPVFSDITTLTLVFPEVAVGDTVAVTYRLTQTEPMFPGHFSVMNTFSKVQAYDDVKITIDAPVSIWVQHASRDMAERRSEADGRVTWQWSFTNPQPVKSKRQDWSVYEIEKEPGFAFSTFRTYADIAEAYGARARAKSAVTPRIKKLAEDIAGDRKTVREQARALYDWVATNITYAGNCIGVGAVVPHDLDFILDNRMGDCKDHATLLQALLAAKGIESTQALINARNVYHLPKIPVAASVNHVINYLPSLGLYVDSTSQTTPFGMLPASGIDKQVLLVDGYRDGLRTPVPAVGSNQQHVKSVIRVAADGSAKGNIEVRLQGVFAEHARAGIRQLPKDRMDEIVENVFRGMGYLGSGKVSPDDPKERLDHYRYAISFDMKDMVQLPGPGAMYIYPLFPTEAPVHSFLSAATEPDEVVDTTCMSATSSEEYRYEFPRNMKILSIPDDMKMENQFLSYKASYRQQGNTLIVKRVMEDRTPGHICSPTMASAYKKFASQMAKNVKAQLIYK